LVSSLQFFSCAVANELARHRVNSGSSLIGLPRNPAPQGTRRKQRAYELGRCGDRECPLFPL
jgi:hypothetical protein